VFFTCKAQSPSLAQIREEEKVFMADEMDDIEFEEDHVSSFPLMVP